MRKLSIPQSFILQRQSTHALLIYPPICSLTQHNSRALSTSLRLSGRRTTKMSWMDSWSRPSKHQATPAPYYLLPGGEDTPYCHSCGRVINSRRTTGTSDDKGGTQQVKYCSSRCRSHKPGKLDREIEGVFVKLLDGHVEGSAAIARAGRDDGAGGGKRGAKKTARAAAGKKVKGDARILVSCDEVERNMFGAKDDASSHASGTDDDGHTEEGDPTGPDPPQNQGTESNNGSQIPSGTGTIQDPVSSSTPPVDYDRLARLSIRSGTRIRPPQSVSEVNGSVGGEKGKAERVEETEQMLEKRREGLRRARQKEMVRCAARRGVVFGFDAADGEQSRKCEAVMLGKVVEPSFAKGDWSVRWRE